MFRSNFRLIVLDFLPISEQFSPPFVQFFYHPLSKVLGILCFLFRFASLSFYFSFYFSFFEHPPHSLNFFRIFLCLFPLTFLPSHLLFRFFILYPCITITWMPTSMMTNTTFTSTHSLFYNTFISFSILFLIILHWTHGFAVDTW